MKKLVWICLGVLIGLGGNIFDSFERTVIAQETQVGIGPCLVCRGPAEEILKQEISDGLKRFLLADLFATHGDYDQALEIVDYTKPITILEKQIAAEEDPELIRLLEYQRQKIEIMRTESRAMLTQEGLKKQADALYEKALTYQKFEKYDQATQALQEALELYQKLQIVRKYEEMQKLLKEIEGKTTTN
jgi:tetratricopeptide (TPR) repeat protein